VTIGGACNYTVYVFTASRSKVLNEICTYMPGVYALKEKHKHM